MSDVFISHVGQDSAIAEAIADALAAAGYDPWCYERNSVPGAPYIGQVLTALSASSAVVVVLSHAAFASLQVDKEIIQAYEGAKPFVPLLLGVAHAEFRAHKAEWAMMLGASTSVAIPPQGVAAIMPKVVEGLKVMGVHPSREPGRPSLTAASSAAAAQPVASSGAKTGSAVDSQAVPPLVASVAATAARRPVARAFVLGGTLVLMGVIAALALLRSGGGDVGPATINEAAQPAPGEAVADPAAASGPPRGPLLYQLEVSDGRANLPYDKGYSNNPHEDKITVAGNALRFAASAGSVVGVGAPLRAPLGDFVAEVRARIVEGQGTYNVHFHVTQQEQGYNWHFVRFSTLGSVQLSLQYAPELAGRTKILATETLAPPGDQETLLTVVARGPDQTVYVNGREAGSGSDGTLTRGGINFQANGGSQPFVVDLTGWSIYAPAL